MIPNVCSYASKLTLIAALMLGIQQGAVAQRKPKSLSSTFENFLDTQWWLGLRFGLNYTQPDPVSRYSSLNAIDYEKSALEKSYDVLAQAGAQAGLDVTFYHQGISLELQPTFKVMRYSYFSKLEWTGNSNADRFETRYDIIQSLRVLEVPLVVKYDIIQHGTIRPFVMAGLQHSFLIGAEKDTEITHTDYVSGSPEEFSGGKISLGVKDQFKNFYGAVGGIGVNLDAGNIRTIFEATYLYGLNSATKTGSLYRENELVSLGEVNDEIKLNNLNFSLSFVFPLRYIDKTFQPY